MAYLFSNNDGLLLSWPASRSFMRRLVQEKGLEPPLPFGNWILNPARLPIPPLLRVIFYISIITVRRLKLARLRLWLRSGSLLFKISKFNLLSSQIAAQPDEVALATKTGGLHRTRTYNPQIKSLLLYQLS